MGVPYVAFTWKSIKVLRAIVCTMSAIGLIIVFTAILWAIRLRRDIGDYLNLVVPGDGHLWPTVIIVGAVPCAPVYLLGLKAYLCLRLATPRTKYHANEKNGSDDEPNSEHSSDDSNDNDDEDDEKNKGTNRILFFHAILCLFSGCLVAAINVACFLKSNTFQERIIDDGLIEAMENYSSDDAARSHVDSIQLEFQCCGSEDYRDWFRVSWAKQSAEYLDYLGVEHQQEAFRTQDERCIFYFERLAENYEDGRIQVKDVPFSCCTNKIVGPCGRREVLRASTVCNFDSSNEEAIWNVGCRPIIIARARVIGVFLIFFLLFLAVYQVVLFVFSRFLQTAYSIESYIGPEMEYYHGWIFSGVSSTCCARFHRNSSQDSDEETLETRSPIKETSDSPIVYLNSKENDLVEWKLKRDHEFMLTPRGSVQLVQVGRLRKAKSNPVLLKNITTNERARKSKEKLDYYMPIPMDVIPDPEPSQIDKKISIHRSDKSMKTSSRSRERLSSKKSSVHLAPVPPPFPPQSDEYDEERNLVNKSIKIDESWRGKLRSSFVPVTNNENTEQKVEKESTSKPSKHERKKLLEKFEKVLKVDDTSRREFGGADVPRPWEQLVQRGINSSEWNDRVIDENPTRPIPKINEQSNVLSRFRSSDAYDRFRGTLQDTLSRRINPRESSNPIGRSFNPGTCACCIKRNTNFAKFSRNNIERTSPSYPVDPEDPGIVHRRSLLPDIPCPPPPSSSHTNPCVSTYYPRPTLIKQQQREQRRQRQWNFRQNLTNDQPPPWTLPASFKRTLISNANPDDDCRICGHGRTLYATNEGYSTIKKNESIKKHRHFMD